MKSLLFVLVFLSIQTSFSSETLYVCTAQGGSKVELLVSAESALLGADEYVRDLSFNGNARYRRFTTVSQDSAYATLMIPGLLMRNRSNQGVVRAFTQEGQRVFLSCQK